MEVEKKWYTNPLLWWVLIIIAAGLVYFTGITHESIWYDEAYSSIMAGHSLGEIIHYIPYDNHPPLYYLLLHFVVSLLGNSVWALRALSAIAAIALVGLGAGPVRRIFGNTTAYIFAIVTLFTPVILIYAHEARMYTLAVFCVTAGALYAYLAALYNRKSDWACFGLATLAAAYLHYYGMIAAFFTHAVLFAWLLTKKREFLRSYLITGAIVAAAYLPWVAGFVYQTLVIQKGFWLGPVTVEAVAKAFLQPFAYKEFYPRLLPTMSAVTIFSIALVIFGVVIAKRKQAENEAKLGLLLLCVYLCTMVTTIIVSLLLRPIFFSRYMIVLVGLFLLLISLGISLLPHKWMRVSAVGMFALLNVFTLKDIYTQYFNYPMQEVASYYKPDIHPGDLIITSDSYSMGPALYYFPQAVHYYSNNSVEAQWGQVLVPLSPYLYGDEDRDSLLSSHSSFWYITCNTGISKDVHTILKGKTGWELVYTPVTFRQPYSFVAFTVARYAHTGKEPGQQLGSLTVQISGVRPPGDLMLALYDHLPITPNLPPYSYAYIHASGKELSYTFDGVDYGEYVLAIMHDENYNHTPDFGSDGTPLEGFTIVNLDKADLSQGLNSVKMENLIFSFNEPEMTVMARMYYPPFNDLQNK